MRSIPKTVIPWLALVTLVAMTRTSAKAQDVATSEAEDGAKINEEFGDLLFAFANLARHLKIDPEASLRVANAKFVRRFKVIEDGLRARGKSLEEASLDEMEALWNEAKRSETSR